MIELAQCLTLTCCPWLCCLQVEQAQPSELLSLLEELQTWLGTGVVQAAREAAGSNDRGKLDEIKGEAQALVDRLEAMLQQQEQLRPQVGAACSELADDASLCCCCWCTCLLLMLMLMLMFCTWAYRYWQCEQHLLSDER